MISYIVFGQDSALRARHWPFLLSFVIMLRRQAAEAASTVGDDSLFSMHCIKLRHDCFDTEHFGQGHLSQAPERSLLGSFSGLLVHMQKRAYNCSLLDFLNTSSGAFIPKVRARSLKPSVHDVL